MCFSPIPSPVGLKQFYKLVHSHALPHKIFEEKVQNLLELFSKVPFNQALVFSNLHTRFVPFIVFMSCLSKRLTLSDRIIFTLPKCYSYYFCYCYYGFFFNIQVLLLCYYYYVTVLAVIHIKITCLLVLLKSSA